MSVHTLSAHLHMCTYVHIESYMNIHEKWEKRWKQRRKAEGRKRGRSGRRELF